MNRLILIFTGLLFIISIGCNSRYSNNNSIRLQDVSAITFRRGEWTVAGRNPSVSKLQCVGGTGATYAYKVESVQCVNIGFDGNDVQWECKSLLDSDLRLAKSDIICEGYDYPEDSYILKGSCNLEYTLEYNPVYRETSTDTYTTYATSYDNVPLGVFLVRVFVVLSIMVVFIIIFAIIDYSCKRPTRVVMRDNGSNFVDGFVAGSSMSNKTYPVVRPAYTTHTHTHTHTTTNKSVPTKNVSTTFATTKRK